MLFCRRVCLAFLLIAFGCETLSLRADDADRVEEQLVAFGIEPDQESLGKYLRALHPDETSRERIKALIQQLGHADFFKREEATNTLLRFPVRSPELLQIAIDGKDPEIRWRAKQVKKLSQQRVRAVLTTVFQQIRAKKYRTLLKPALEAMPFCESPFLIQQAHKSLKSVATADDVELLRDSLSHRSADVRRAAVVALEHVQQEKADAVIIPLLKDGEPVVRLTAARALANHGTRDSLPVLGNLLGDDNLQVRLSAAQALRNLTGRQFGFVPYDDAEKRTAAAEKWTEWLAANADTVKLKFPLSNHKIFLGRTLLANYSMGQVIEQDADGKQIWNASVQTPYRVQGLPNGHRMVAAYSPRSVSEYGINGEVVWSVTVPGLPYSVQRLPNGNTLVGCSNNKVMEYRPDKTVAWEASVSSTPRDAVRLENGNTLVALYSTRRVVELDRDKKVVWQMDNMQRPTRVQRLENGNTVILQYSIRTVLEVDKDKKTVWSKRVNSSLYDMQRLPNGNTIVVTSSGIEEFDSAGKSLSSKRTSGLRAIHRY